MTSVYFSVMDSDEKDYTEEPFSPGNTFVTPLFGKPIEIGCFSVDATRVVRFDNSQMKYLKLPTKYDFCFDLNVNFETDIRHNYVTLSKMHNTLNWLLHTQENSSEPSIMNGIDFVTARGTLKLVACTTYLKGFYRNQWEICASKFQGTIYFSAIDTDNDIEENNNLTKRQEMLQAWGYKFEQYVTTDTPNGEINIDSHTSQMEEYCIVLKNKIQNYTLLYTAEIDAVIPHRHPGPGSGNTTCYTELKTSRSITNEGQKYYFHRYKLVTWWAQSYLTGIPEIICGLRDDEGIVKELEYFQVSTLPQRAKGLWSSDACMNFCVKFLDFLKRTVTEDDNNIVYKFFYQGEDIIYCNKLIDPIPRYKVIPDWYVERKNKQTS